MGVAVSELRSGVKRTQRQQRRHCVGSGRGGAAAAAAGIAAAAAKARAHSVASHYANPPDRSFQDERVAIELPSKLAE